MAHVETSDRKPNNAHPEADNDIVAHPNHNGHIAQPNGHTLHEGNNTKDMSGSETDKVPLLTRLLIELKRWQHYKNFLGEVFGTALLMFFVGGISMSHDPHITLMTHAAAAALGIMIIIFMFGTISGAHVNPAVTFGFACANKMPWMKVPIYFAGQIVGSVVGTLVASAIFDAPAAVMLSTPYQGVPKSFLIEVMVAFIFMFLACAVATNAHVTGLFAAVAVAVSIAVNILVAGPISGASMNPARSLGPALVTGHFKDVWLYLVAPMVGAPLGAACHYLLNL